MLVVHLPAASQTDVPEGTADHTGLTIPSGAGGVGHDPRLEERAMLRVAGVMVLLSNSAHDPALAAPRSNPPLSVVVVAQNMARELPCTLPSPSVGTISVRSIPTKYEVMGVGHPLSMPA